MVPYTPPTLDGRAFNCPHCNAYASQIWSPLFFREFDLKPMEGFLANQCQHCGRHCMWVEDQIVHPTASQAPLPNPDMPADVRQDYDEARDIVAVSPRGAAALLRLAIQRLCQHLGEPGKTLNSDIGALVQKGLPATVQQSLDVVRVIGNNAVHPGVMDISDDVPTATALFNLVNIIVQVMITQPMQIQALYEALPPSQLQQIERRDKGAPS